MAKERVASPWGYLKNAFSRSNGNYNERDAIAESEKFKRIAAADSDFMGLIGDIGIRL